MENLAEDTDIKSPKYRVDGLSISFEGERSDFITLHSGVVWGDVKSDNVLIDKDSNAWIIDFEGGYIEGWVDRNKAGTVEGDLQGLANIVNFVFEEKTVSEHPDNNDDNYR